jgi:hypothetical protein
MGADSPVSRFDSGLVWSGRVATGKLEAGGRNANGGAGRVGGAAVGASLGWATVSKTGDGGFPNVVGGVARSGKGVSTGGAAEVADIAGVRLAGAASGLIACGVSWTGG